MKLRSREVTPPKMSSMSPKNYKKERTTSESISKLVFVKKQLVCVLNKTPSDFAQNIGQNFRIAYSNLFVESNQIIKRAKLCSLMLNLLLGVVFSSTLLIYRFSLIRQVAFEISIYMEEMMAFLTSVINWLMGVPAGLKLNRPLTEFLGRFFLYHIYLWDSSILIFKEVLPYFLEAIVFSGFLGISAFLSLCKDALSIFVIHTYCFYVYALRIYKLELDSLKALFRLFRGKKYNPLRLRIDSYSYDTNQLFIGTLGFCIAFFLLPTILMFYVVFLSLRIIHLITDTTLGLVIPLIGNIPIYEIYLYFVRTSIVSDKTIYIVEKKCKDENIIYSLGSKKVKRDLSEILMDTDWKPCTLDVTRLKTILSNILNGVKI